MSDERCGKDQEHDWHENDVRRIWVCFVCGEIEDYDPQDAA